MFFYAKEIDVFEYFSSQPDYVQLQGPIFKDLDQYKSPQIEELFDSLTYSEFSCFMKIYCSEDATSQVPVISFTGEGSANNTGTHIFLEGYLPVDKWKLLVGDLKTMSAYELKLNFTNVSGRVLERSEDGFTKFKIGIELDFFKWSKRNINGN
jgi:hypothetical protein